MNRRQILSDEELNLSLGLGRTASEPADAASASFRAEPQGTALPGGGTPR